MASSTKFTLLLQHFPNCAVFLSVFPNHAPDQGLFYFFAFPLFDIVTNTLLVLK